jgi:Kef-type K+ transport system membrane component KefB
MLGTPLGVIAIACAAVDDVTGWIILAGVVLLARAGEAGIPFWLTMAGVIVYIVVMLFGVRRWLKNLEARFERRGRVSQDALAAILLLLLASSWITETLGIHALFGAFLVGAIMPKKPGFVEALDQKLNDAAVVLLLPLFFAFTGLRTSIGLVSGAEMWFYCALVIAVAIIGKFGGSTLSARLTGMSWREAGALGILMNTRGLMELVLLNIGLDIGVISPALFAMLVLMALVTTFMTAPIFEWVYYSRVIPQEYPRVDHSSESADDEKSEKELFKEVSTGLGYEFQAEQGD